MNHKKRRLSAFLPLFLCCMFAQGEENFFEQPLIKAAFFCGITSVAQLFWQQHGSTTTDTTEIPWKKVLFHNILDGISLIVSNQQQHHRLAYPSYRAGFFTEWCATLIKGAWIVYRAKLLLEAHKRTEQGKTSLIPSRELTHLLTTFVSPLSIYLSPFVGISLCHEGGHYLLTRLLAPWMDTKLTIASANGPHVVQHGVLPLRGSQAAISAAGGLAGGLATLLVTRYVDKLTQSKEYYGVIAEQLFNRIESDGPLLVVEELDNLLLPWKTDSRNIHQALGLSSWFQASR